MIDTLITLLVSSFIIFSIFIFVFVMPRERFPRWLFGLLCAWWWPKPETPATLLYVAVDCMDDEMIDKAWDGANREWQSVLLKATISDHSEDGRMRLHMNRERVVTNLWDDYLLAKISKRVGNAKRAERQRNQLRATAQVMLHAAGVIKTHVAELEHRAQTALPPAPTNRTAASRVSTYLRFTGSSSDIS